VLAPRPTDGTVVPARPLLPGAVGGVLGLPAGAVAAMAAWALGGSPTTGLVLATAAAATLGAIATTPGAVVAATLCWACYDGFVLHTLGTLEGGRADLVALAVVVVAALAAQLVGAVTRHAQAVGAGSGRLAPVSGRLARMECRLAGVAGRRAGRAAGGEVGRADGSGG
jgi:hypothetical protein